jgi:hypothetical protein
MSEAKRDQTDPPPSWEHGAVPDSDYERIARALASADSPVGIDAKHTHVLILHALDRIEKRLARLERRFDGGTPPGV